MEHIINTLVVVADWGVGGNMTGMSTVRERESSLAPSCCASHQDTGGRSLSGTPSNERTHAQDRHIFVFTCNALVILTFFNSP